MTKHHEDQLEETSKQNAELQERIDELLEKVNKGGQAAIIASPTPLVPEASAPVESDLARLTVCKFSTLLPALFIAALDS
jgi:cell division septum initiation protein DivIVA